MYKLANWVPRSEFNKPLFTPEIEYEFEVITVTEGVYPSSNSPKWDLVLNIWKPDGNVHTYKTSLSMHEKMLWQVCSFLDCIGAGFMWEKLGTEGINLFSLSQRTGKLIFKLEKYTGNDGQEKETLKVKKFIKKEDGLKTKLESAPIIDDEIPW